MSLLRHWFLLWARRSSRVLFTRKSFFKLRFLSSTSQLCKRPTSRVGGERSHLTPALHGGPSVWCSSAQRRAPARCTPATVPPVSLEGKLVKNSPHHLGYCCHQKCKRQVPLTWYYTFSWNLRIVKILTAKFVTKLLYFRLTVHTTSWYFIQES